MNGRGAAIAQTERDCNRPVPLPFSDTIDDCIVEWFLTEENEILKGLINKGYPRRAVVARARKLGLSDQFLRRCTVGRPDVALRNCLGCAERFLSVGRQNRLCPRCRGRSG